MDEHAHESDEVRRLLDELRTGDRRAFDVLCARFRDELKPNYALAHLNLGNTLLRRNNAKEAVITYQKLVELKPKNADCWNTLGAARYRAGEYKTAVDALQTAVKLRPKAAGHDELFLAMSLYKLGDGKNARMWFDRAVKSMNKQRPRSTAFIRLHKEAATLLGVKTAD